jgi:hypothetical protein
MMPPASTPEYFVSLDQVDDIMAYYQSDDYANGVIRPHKARLLRITKLKLNQPDMLSDTFAMEGVTYYIIDVAIVEFIDVIPEKLKQPIVPYNRKWSSRTFDIVPK